MEFFHKAESWVLVSFLLFVALLIYLKVPAMLAKMLDERAAKISKDLDEARKLREEAQALLDSYKKKRVEAETEAANIISQAKVQAEDYAVESRRKLDESLTRRTKQAEQKIAQAEAAAMKDVRTIATNIAIAAATKLTATSLTAPKKAKLVEDSIAAVKARLN
jgi:F-type H+-transporting ATPase subunit b